MSLMINHNMMATVADRNLNNSFASLADSGSRAGDNTGDNAGLRQIVRAEVIPLDSAGAQPTAAAPETATASGAQGASTGASETQASPVAPEQQTGSILNTTDSMSTIREGLSSLMDANQMRSSSLLSDMGSKNMGSSLMDMGTNQDVRTRLLKMELSDPSSLNDVSAGLDKLNAMQDIMTSGNQNMLESVSRNASMVNALFKNSG